MAPRANVPAVVGAGDMGRYVWGPFADQADMRRSPKIRRLTSGNGRAWPKYAGRAPALGDAGQFDLYSDIGYRAAPVARPLLSTP